MAGLRQRDVATGLEIGERYVRKTGIESDLGPGRKLASFSEAKSTDVRGWLWISAEGVPTVAGNYRLGDNGALAPVPDRLAVDWKRRLYVTEQAAEMAARGEGPLVLGLWNDGYGHLQVTSLEGAPDGVARVASMPKTEMNIEAAAEKITAQLLVKADASLTDIEEQTGAYESGWEKGVYLHKESLVPLREILDILKRA